MTIVNEYPFINHLLQGGYSKFKAEYICLMCLNVMNKNIIYGQVKTNA